LKVEKRGNVFDAARKSTAAAFLQCACNPLPLRIFDAFANLLVVLNVVGSSPTLHPTRKGLKNKQLTSKTKEESRPKF
jgi:hypothetical protein